MHPWPHVFKPQGFADDPYVIQEAKLCNQGLRVEIGEHTTQAAKAQQALAAVQRQLRETQQVSPTHYVFATCAICPQGVSQE